MKEFLEAISGLLCVIMVVCVFTYGLIVGINWLIPDMPDSECVNKLARHEWARDYNARNAFFCTKCLTIKDFAKTAEVSLSSEVSL